MSAPIPKALFASVVLTLASVAANHLYPETHWPNEARVNHGPGESRDCGPGPSTLVVGASVAYGVGASDTEHEWWVIACHALGGRWFNAAGGGHMSWNEVTQIRDNPGYDRVVVLDGANDLVLGLWPSIRGQIDVRYPRWKANIDAMRAMRPDMLHVLQPIPFGVPCPCTAGHEAELRSVYDRMAAVADVDLSRLDVDYVDVVHFGDRGHGLVADAIVGVMRFRDAATRREGG